MTATSIWAILLQLFGSGCLIVVIRVAVSLRDNVRDLVLEVRTLHATCSDHEQRLRWLESGRRHHPREAGA